MVEKRYEYGRVPRPQIETMAPDRSAFLGTGIMGLSDFISDIFTPARREIIEEPKVDFFTAKEYQQINPGFFADSVVDPNETIAVQQSAGVYGEPEFGFEYMPAARFASDAVDYVKSFVTDEKTRDAAAQTAARIPGIVADELEKQKESVAVGRTVYDPETGSTTTFDPLVAGVGTLATARLISGMPDDSVGVMGGSKAVGYNRKRDAYYQSLSDDKAKGKELDPRKAYNKSGGGFEDPLAKDFDFRFLIDSRKAKLKPEFIVDFKPVFTIGGVDRRRTVGDKTTDGKLKDYGSEDAKRSAGFGLNNTLVLEDVLDFPELYTRYPKLRNYSVRRLSRGTGAIASFDPEKKEIKIRDFEPGEEDNAVSSLLHETQHAIDDIEGVDPGANSKIFEPPNFDKLRQATYARRSEAQNNVQKAGFSAGRLESLEKIFRRNPTEEGVIFGPQAVNSSLIILPIKDRVDDVFENLKRAYENIKKNDQFQQNIKDARKRGRSNFYIGDKTDPMDILDDSIQNPLGAVDFDFKYYDMMEKLFGKDTKTSLFSKTSDKTNNQNIVKDFFESNRLAKIIRETEDEAIDNYFKTKGEINARAAQDFFESTELQDFYPEILLRKAQERPTGGRLFPADATFDDVMRGIVRKDEVDRRRQQLIDRLRKGMSEGGEVKKGIGSMAREVL